MRGYCETLVFLGLAAGVHAAVLVGFAPAGLPNSAGGGGAAIVTLNASVATSAQVAVWQTPPVVHAMAIKRHVPAQPRLQPQGAAAKLWPRPALPGASDLQPVSLPADATPADAAPKPPAMPNKVAAPVQPNAPQVAQRAAGAGGSGAKGTSVPRRQASLSPGQTTALLAEWGAQIRARVEARKKRPSGSRATGRVVVRIEVARDGTLRAARLVQSSEHAALDRAALNAVRRAGRFPPAPKALEGGGQRFDLPITFAR